MSYSQKHKKYKALNTRTEQEVKERVQIGCFRPIALSDVCLHYKCPLLSTLLITYYNYMLTQWLGTDLMETTRKRRER
jgi:hypothetical protein